MAAENLRRDFKRNLPHGLRSLFNLIANPGFVSILVYRYNHFASQCSSRILRVLLLIPGKIVEKIYGDFYGIKISRKASIGGGLKISHFGGIFINGEVVCGENVTISQGVTIGIWGRGAKRGAPIIGNNVYIAPGAKLFGKITIGNNVRIGANAVIFFDVPNGAVVRAPAATIKMDEVPS